MITGLAFVKGIHLGAVVGLVGCLGFVLLVLRELPAPADSTSGAVLARADWLLVRTASGCLGLAVASALAWLALHAARAAGSGIGGAVESDVIARVLSQTSFGQVWLVRLGLLALVGAFLLLRRYERDVRDRLALRVECLLLGAAALGALAWTGHGVAVEEGLRTLSLATDVVHLLACGLWLGGLPGLALVLALLARGTDPRAMASVAHAIVRRFSALAAIAVCALILTGSINAWLLVGGIAGLAGTPYGWLLLTKLLLLLPLLGLAGVNRWWLKPRLGVAVTRAESDAAPSPIRQLSWSAGAEAFLGMLVLLVVGALGVTPPGRHVDPWWPFSVRLSWSLALVDPATPVWLVGGALFATAGLATLVYVIRRRAAARWLVVAGVALVGYGVMLGFFAFPVIDAYPTTYVRPTVPYQAVSIARGGELYAKHCAVCHGPSGRGDGPAARNLPREPANLTAPHTADHTAGDLFWWLTHGIPRSGMPGFQGVMDDTERWDVINFVRVLAADESARRLGPEIGPPLIAAPDFSFGVGVGPTETLRDHRGGSIVHLVLFSLPDSLSRLEEIDRGWTKIGLAGARVIAVPMRDARETYRRLGIRVANPAIAVEGSEEIVTAYALLARPTARVPGAEPNHVEFLIDRQGWVRARWIPGQEPTWTDMAVLLGQIYWLDKELPSTEPREEHVH